VFKKRLFVEIAYQSHPDSPSLDYHLPIEDSEIGRGECSRARCKKGNPS
jgi:hypothetical protein